MIFHHHHYISPSLLYFSSVKSRPAHNDNQYSQRSVLSFTEYLHVKSYCKRGNQVNKQKAGRKWQKQTFYINKFGKTHHHYCLNLFCTPYKWKPVMYFSCFTVSRQRCKKFLTQPLAGPYFPYFKNSTPGQNLWQTENSNWSSDHPNR